MLKTGELSFATQDIKELESSIVGVYETISNKKLFDGDPVRIFLQALTQIIFQQSMLIDFSAKQNLLAYATDEYLDGVVALVGVTRMEPSSAMTTFKFIIGSPQPDTTIVIPKGTRIKGNGLYFKTIEVGQISPGDTEIAVIGECDTPGTIGNNMLPGQIVELVDVFPFYKSVSNITTSSGGNDLEGDDSLRQRAFEAPTAYSTAGSDSAYAFWAKTASQAIMDVKVISPKAGEISIIVIGKNGDELSSEVLEKILVVCSDKKVKPLTDKVSVSNASQVNYGVDLVYYIDKVNQGSISQIQGEVAKAIERYLNWQNSKLGRDINPNKLLYELMSVGIKRVEINGPVFTKVEDVQIAKNTAPQIRYGGIEDE